MFIKEEENKIKEDFQRIGEKSVDIYIALQLTYLSLILTQ